MTPPTPEGLRAAAKELGIDPIDLATVIAYETNGTFSPSIMGGKGGNYMGLIQFGPAERRQFGAHSAQTGDEQLMESVVPYLKTRGFKPGMSILDLYSTINAGTPGRYNASDKPGMTVRSHVAGMKPFAKMAAAYLGPDEGLAAGWHGLSDTANKYGPPSQYYDNAIGDFTRYLEKNPDLTPAYTEPERPAPRSIMYEHTPERSDFDLRFDPPPSPFMADEFKPPYQPMFDNPDALADFPGVNAATNPDPYFALSASRVKSDIPAVTVHPRPHPGAPSGPAPAPQRRGPFAAFFQHLFGGGDQSQGLGAMAGHNAGSYDNGNGAGRVGYTPSGQKYTISGDGSTVSWTNKNGHTFTAPRSV